MKLSHLKIVAISGPDSGKTFEVRGRSVVGRNGEECDIVLSDPSVSRRHLEIFFSEKPYANAMERGKPIGHNGLEVGTADLGDEDVLQVGHTKMKVYFVFIEESEGAADSPAKKGRLLLLLVVLVVIAVGAIFYVTKKKSEQALRETPLTARDYTVLDTVFSDHVRLRVPDFYPEGEVIASQHPFFVRHEEIQDQRDINYQSKLPNPPDPFGVNFSSARRNWTTYPPRLGNGHLLHHEKIMLGDYFAALITYSNQEYSSIAPASYTANGGRPTALQLRFSVEVYDGLPREAEMGYFRLSDQSSDPYYEHKPLIPKLFFQKVPGQSGILDSGAKHEVAIMTKPSDGLTVRMEQRLEGETLTILTAWYWDFQEERVKQTMDFLFDAQETLDFKRGHSRQYYIDEAQELETEADGLLGGDPREFVLRDWELISRDDRRLAEVFKAFHRYEQALVDLQIVGKWQYDEDHKRVMEKTETLWEFVQSEDSVLQKMRRSIELSYTSPSQFRDVKDTVERLYRLTLNAQEPGRFPIDEWYIYAKLRYMRLQMAL